MAVYIDTPFTVGANHPTAPRCFKGKQSAHLMADTDEELIAYALSIGMKRSWLQHGGTIRAHFDLTGEKLRKALTDPSVIKVTPKEMVRWYMARAKAAQEQAA